MVEHIGCFTKSDQAKKQIIDTQADHGHGAKVKFLVDADERITDHVGGKGDVKCKAKDQGASNRIDNSVEIEL